jgi:GDP-mannose 6-dehydrogenase
VVVRSTVAPGTVEGVLTPLLEEHAGKKAGQDFDVCFQPEFLREGSSIRDYDDPPFTIVGAASECAAEPLRALFGHLKGEFRVCSIATAEMLKYTCNVFHALKITFANEMGRICQALEVDAHAVMDLVCRDTHLNISPAYLRPGFAYGGSCLPKDLAALRHLASRRDVIVPMISAIAQSNAVHIDHALDLVLATGARSVGMIGLSHKAGTDDLRESPLVVMAERLIGKGLKLTIYDPDVHVARLLGANRRYIEESIPHLAALMAEDPRAVVDGCDVLVVGLKNDAVLAALREGCRDEHVLLDLVNLPDRGALKGRYRGVCW